MSGLRSLRHKLALIFFLVTAAAFSAIFFVVVPQLEQSLKDQRLDDLEEEAKAARSALELLRCREGGSRWRRSSPTESGPPRTPPTRA